MLGFKAAEVGIFFLIVCLSLGVSYRATAPSSCLSWGRKEGEDPKISSGWDMVGCGYVGPPARQRAGPRAWRLRSWCY